jgi:predicted nucleic acid-binding protein
VNVGLADHRRVGIDSNVLIYVLEGSGPLAKAAAALLDRIASGEVEGVLATLAIAEVATGPARAGDLQMVRRYANELSSLEGVQVVPLDIEVAVEAALIRGSGSLTLTDAIHLASARMAGASAFVTNDRRITSLPGLEVAYLNELILNDQENAGVSADRG